MEFTSLDHHVWRKIDPDCLSATRCRRRSDVPWTGCHVEQTDTFLDTCGVQKRFGKCGCRSAEGSIVFSGGRVPAGSLEVAERARVSRRCCHVLLLSGLDRMTSTR